MCRSIKQLRIADRPATDDEVRAAALQFVRKISGFRAPSKVNEAPFTAAVDEVAAASTRLLESLKARSAPAGQETPAGGSSSGRQLLKESRGSVTHTIIGREFDRLS